MAFSTAIAEMASDLTALTGEPCAVYVNGVLYSAAPSGEPIFANIQEGLVADSDAFSSSMNTYTEIRLAKADVPELVTPSGDGDITIACNAANDSRGGEFLGGTYAEQVWAVDKIEPERSDGTFHMRCTKAQSRGGG